MKREELTILPMPVGAEVMGLKPGDEHDPGIRATLYDAWLAHGVLLFRSVETNDQHIALSRVFGELELHPLEFMRAKYEPLFMEMGAGGRRGQAFVYDGAEMRLGRLPWHRDTAYTPDICKGAMLRMLTVPPTDGETMFADTAMAYDALPAALKTRLEGLEYLTSLHPIKQDSLGWKTMRVATAEEDPDASAKLAGFDTEGPLVVHPIVMTHPESGRKCIFLSPKDAVSFVGMEQSESDALLRTLADHMTEQRFVYKHRWALGDALLWDNRRIIHAALGYHVQDSRWCVRTTLSGAMRTGRYLDETIRIEETPFAMD